MQNSRHPDCHHPLKHSALLLAVTLCFSAGGNQANCQELPSPVGLTDPALKYVPYHPQKGDRIISRSKYLDQLYGFWLGECIANWTGLVTEMDKIGNIGDIKTGDFYTRADWGQPDRPNIWSGNEPSKLSPVIDFVFEKEGGAWGSDDDTDIEYIYQHLLYTHQTSILTGEQIREGWLRHIKADEENFLWVSNQKAFDLMKSGMVPPATSDPAHNPEYEMIDAQLTTEVFGLFAPARPDVALAMAQLPIQTTARENARWISEFYVIMHSLASYVDENKSMKDKVLWMADKARQRLPNDAYSAKMYDYVKSRYEAGAPWEQTRDEVYRRYQVEQADGYLMTAQKRYCNGCYAAGINLAASIVSLLYGEGDIKETIKIAALAGWDSDNPTSTWGGLLGFMLGKKGVEDAFGRKFADKFNIHRTRVGFPDNGIDSFHNMAKKGLWIVDRVVQEQMGGGIDLKKDVWYIPERGLDFPAGGQKAISSTDVLTISGAVRAEKKFNCSDIQKFPSTTIGDIAIKNHTGIHKGTAKALKGILLKDLLSELAFTAESPKDLSAFTLVFKASDGYCVAYSWNELFNSETGNNTWLIVEKDGKQLPEMDERFLTLTTTDTHTGRRYVKRLSQIIVVRTE